MRLFQSVAQTDGNVNGVAVLGQSTATPDAISV
jgi:hypothetical protein